MISSAMGRAVGYRARDGVGWSRAGRTKPADQRAPGGDVPCQVGGRWTDRRGLEREDRERPRIDRAVPADDVERESARVKPCQEPERRTTSSRMPSIARRHQLGALEVAVRVRRVHAELADRVAALCGMWRPPISENQNHAADPGQESDAAGRADEHVVALRNATSPIGCAARRRAMDVDQLIGVAVGHVDRIVGGRNATPATTSSLNSSATRASICAPRAARARRSVVRLASARSPAEIGAAQPCWAGARRWVCGRRR